MERYGQALRWELVPMKCFQIMNLCQTGLNKKEDKNEKALGYSLFQIGLDPGTQTISHTNEHAMYQWTQNWVSPSLYLCWLSPQGTLPVLLGGQCGHQQFQASFYCCAFSSGCIHLIQCDWPHLGLGLKHTQSEWLASALLWPSKCKESDTYWSHRWAGEAICAEWRKENESPLKEEGHLRLCGQKHLHRKEGRAKK